MTSGMTTLAASAFLACLPSQTQVAASTSSAKTPMTIKEAMRRSAPKMVTALSPRKPLLAACRKATATTQTIVVGMRNFPAEAHELVKVNAVQRTAQPDRTRT